MIFEGKFFDPLRVFGVSTIAGDIFLLRSGMDFSNYARMVPAAFGILIGLISLQGLNFKIGSISAPRFVMATFVIFGFMYVISGSNLLGFEKFPRYGEVCLGLAIMIGSLLNLAGQSALSVLVYVVGTLATSEGAVEPLFSGRHFDINMFGAFLCFMTANILSYWIKSKKTEGPLAYETQI